MLTDASRAIIAQIDQMVEALRQMDQIADQLYADLEKQLLSDHDIEPNKTWVSNKFGEFLVEGVDNFTLENGFEGEQPTLNGTLNGTGQNRIITTPWRIRT